MDKRVASVISTTTTEISSAREKTRIQALDVIRGISILGILAVNADGFAGPMSASLKPLYWPFPNEGWTAISYWVMDAFFHEKFVALFSMLFGVSLFLVGGERSDKERSRILRRRLLVLLAFAMLHGFGLWWGDILSLYAITGFVMFFFRSWSPRALMLIGLVLFGLTLLRDLPPAVNSTEARRIGAESAVSIERQQSANDARKAAVANDIAEAKSSLAGAYRVNARSYLRLLKGDLSLIPSTLSLMMIGLSLFKSGFLSARSANRRYGTVIALGMAALFVVAFLTWRQDVVGSPIWDGDFLERTLAPLISLAYAAILILLLRSGGRATSMLGLFAATGRMAFTNYLMQSLIMTSIFYGGRGALMGEVDRPALWGIVFGIWILQMTWSPLWLSRFEMGPFEWGWRCLTHGRRIPFLKHGIPTST
ncbi:MAG: DUF418 domain-containing protein [Pseudoxanthomonas sp.]